MAAIICRHIPLLLSAIDVAITISLSTPPFNSAPWDFVLLALLRTVFIAINCSASLLHVERNTTIGNDSDEKPESPTRPWLSRLPGGIWVATYSFSLLRLLPLEIATLSHFRLAAWSIIATSLLYCGWRKCWSVEIVTDEIPGSEESMERSHLKQMLVLLGYSRPYLKQMLLGSAFLALSSFIGLKYAFYHGQVITSMMQREDSPTDFIYASTMMALVSSSGSILVAIEQVVFSRVARRVAMQLRLDLFMAAIRQEIAYFETTPPASITRRLGSNCDRVSRALNRDLIKALQHAFLLVGSLCVMMSFSWRLAMVPVAIIPLTKSLANLRKEDFEEWCREYYKGEEEIDHFINEAMANIRNVRAFAAEKNEHNRYEKKLEENFERVQKVYQGWRRSAKRTICGGMDEVLYFALRFYGGYLVYANVLEPSTIMAFLLTQDQFSQSFHHLVNFYNSLMDTLRASEQVFVSLGRRPRIALGGGFTPENQAKEFLGRIRFHNVSFAYPTRPNVPVLIEVSFEIYPGECIAIVGPSGAGKSTIISLLERFYEPTSGEIFIDDVPISKYDHDFYHRMLALVQQEPVLHSGSVRENILYGLPCKEMAQDGELESKMIKAAELADIHSFILSCPDSYSTKCGERGMQMSGGQKQKIAIARALVRDPRILLLDEATSAMDSNTECRVRESIERCLREGNLRRTLLVVAHRLSTVQSADRILVLDAGKIVQVSRYSWI